MDEATVAHARRGYRSQWVVLGALFVLYAAFAFFAPFLGIPSVLSLVILVVSVLLFVFPLIRFRSETRLLTNRSPAQVRNEFQSVDNPLAIMTHALADDGGVELHETGATYEVSWLFGLRTSRVRYETEEYPNGDLLVRMWQNGTESTVFTVSVEPVDGSETLVAIEAERTAPINVLLLLMMWVNGNAQEASFEANGYEVADNETHIGLR